MQPTLPRGGKWGGGGGVRGWWRLTMSRFRLPRPRGINLLHHAVWRTFQSLLRGKMIMGELPILTTSCISKPGPGYKVLVVSASHGALISLLSTELGSPPRGGQFYSSSFEHTCFNCACLFQFLFSRFSERYTFYRTASWGRWESTVTSPLSGYACLETAVYWPAARTTKTSNSGTWRICRAP